MSPLVWDLAHIAAYEDLWIGHRLGGRSLLRGDLAALYDAFETPRAVRGEIELLDAAAAREYLDEVRAGAIEAIGSAGVGDGVVTEMVVRHELQHTETMRQTMAIAGLLAPGEGATPVAAAPGWLTIAPGRFLMGAPDGRFSYDNERSRHEVELPGFQIAHLPVSNASWMHFSEGGGYERREWWSDEGWAWKEEYDIGHHPAVATGDPEAPVCHVSWFEADAFARAHDARLPTEEEWERAATSDQPAEQPAGIGRSGSGRPRTSSPTRASAPTPTASTRRSSSASTTACCAAARGRRTRASRHARSATGTCPQRRQIFAGLRLARGERG